MSISGDYVNVCICTYVFDQLELVCGVCDCCTTPEAAPDGRGAEAQVGFSTRGCMCACVCVWWLKTMRLRQYDTRLSDSVST